MNQSPTTIEIYVGSPVEQASEQLFLASVIEGLVNQKASFIVLANLHLGGRQIDCIVITVDGVSVVEVKSSYLPVRGDLNGAWQRLDASGEWRNYTNAYQQALNAKNALRDAMATIKPVGRFYPDGYVVFTSGLPEGSQVTNGDFKVKVTTLDELVLSHGCQTKSSWSFDDWRAFSAKIGLTLTSMSDALSSRENREMSELIARHNMSVQTEYGHDAARWLPEDEQQKADLFAAATSSTGCFITGASGCGKTLMAKWLAVSLARTEGPTFFFSAKNFVGSWSDFMRRENALLSDERFASLMRAISRTDKPLFLVLDGLNELGAHWSTALRGIRALARRFGAKLIVTDQGCKPPAFDGLRTVSVKPPSIHLKRLIAQSSGVALSRVATEALKSVRSGIEAQIVGRIGADLSPETTRLVLIEQYIRIRLGRHARAASFGLRRFAGLLHRQVAFSMSEALFDEFMRKHSIDFESCDAMFDSGVLVKRAGRVSFYHEMIQNACAAHDLAHNAATDPKAFGPQLSTPILESIAGDVLSAIEDGPSCRAVLEEVTSPFLLSAAADGELGVVAGSVARALLKEAQSACVSEIRSARLALFSDGNVTQLDWEIDHPENWTDAARARLAAIGQRAASGMAIDDYFSLCTAMDEHLTQERKRLADDARRADFPLRSRSFELAYQGLGKQIGFTYAANASHSGLHKHDAEPDGIEFNLRTLTSGQLYCILQNRYRFLRKDDGDRFVGDLIFLLRERFQREPYHVQLSILNAVALARSTSEEGLSALIEAINALDVATTNWAINSSIIDALKMIGGLDNEGEEARGQIREELASVLGDDENAIDKSLALSLCLRMFDHPFDSIYAEEVFELDEARRRRLYRRALGAPNAKGCFSLTWIAGQVASFEDTSDVVLFQPLATLPDSESVFPQEAWGIYILATRFLGRHHAELPHIDRNLPANCCMDDIRTLLYAAESRQEPDLKNAQQAWTRLHAITVQLAVGCLGELHAALIDRYWGGEEQHYERLDLTDVYPEDCLHIARAFLDSGLNAEYFGRFPMREFGPSFAFYVIGRHGDRSDVDRLRALSHVQPFARHALSALRSLDSIAGLGE